MMQPHASSVQVPPQHTGLLLVIEEGDKTLFLSPQWSKFETFDLNLNGYRDYFV